LWSWFLVVGCAWGFRPFALDVGRVRAKTNLFSIQVLIIFPPTSVPRLVLACTAGRTDRGQPCDTRANPVWYLQLPAHCSPQYSFAPTTNAATVEQVNLNLPTCLPCLRARQFPIYEPVIRVKSVNKSFYVYKTGISECR
jgi:hypothetical protein